MGKFLSASEIAKLKLPGLPTTRAAVNVMAKREQWEFETATGVGGTRRVFKLPAKYAGEAGQDEAKEAPQVPQGIAGTVVAGSSRVDPIRLEQAMRALSEWEAERGVKVAEERRPAVIAILYDYAQNTMGAQGEAAFAMVLRAIG